MAKFEFTNRSLESHHKCLLLNADSNQNKRIIGILQFLIEELAFLSIYEIRIVYF